MGKKKRGERAGQSVREGEMAARKAREKRRLYEVKKKIEGKV